MSSIVDAPDLRIVATKGDSLIGEDTTTFVRGGSSLVIRSYQASGYHHIGSVLDIETPEPGVLEFKLKVARILERDLTIGQASLEDLLVAELEDGWRQYRYLLRPDLKVEQLRIPDSTSAEGQMEVFLDDFLFTPGVVVEVLASAGTVALTPKRSHYRMGETVGAKIAPQAGFRIASVSITDISGHVARAPVFQREEFAFPADRHYRVAAGFEQRISFSGTEVWAQIDDGPISRQVDGSYRSTRFEIDPRGQAGVLRFEASFPGPASVRVTVQAGEGVSYRSFPFDGATQSFRVFEIPIAERADRIWLETRADSGEAGAVRAVSYDTRAQVFCETQGAGEVHIDYAPAPNGFGVIASLTATPAEGWEFHGWEGTFESQRSHLELPVNGIERVVARFSLVFQFDDTRWTFLPEKSLVFETRDSETQGALLRVSGAEDSLVQVLIDFPRAGVFSASQRIHLAGGGSTPPAIPIEFPDAQLGWISAIPVQEGGRQEFVFHAGGDRTWELVENGYDPAELDGIFLEIAAPSGAVTITPDKLTYLPGEKVTLSVTSAFRDRFLGWRGDIVSGEAEHTFAIDGSMKVQAIFRAAIESATTEGAVGTGTALWLNTGTSAKPLYAVNKLLPGAWTELALALEAPLVVELEVSGAFEPSTLEVVAFQGRERLKPLSSGSNFVLLDPKGGGKLSVLVRNNGAQSASLAVRVTGQYQQIVGGQVGPDYVSYGSLLTGSRVTFSPTSLMIPDANAAGDRIRAFPVGSEVTLDPKAEGEVEFLGWKELSLGRDERVYVVRHDEILDFQPLFSNQFGGANVHVLEDTSGVWDTPLGMAPSAAIVGVDTGPLRLAVQGPGALALRIETPFGSPASPLAVRFEIDGEPVYAKSYGLTEGADWHELLVDEGDAELAIFVSTSGEDLELGRSVTVSLAEITFLPGYYVGSAVPWSGAYKIEVAPAAPGNVYARGQTVSVTTSLEPGAAFGGWNGFPGNSPKSFQIQANRHVDLHPIVSSVSRIGGVAVSFSPNSVNWYNGGDASWSQLSLTGERGSSWARFAIPAGTEFGFETQTSHGPLPITLVLDGQTLFSGSSDELPWFTHPVGSVPAVVELFIDSDATASKGGISLTLHAIDSFELWGVFGAESEYVLADPHKDRYDYGDRVKISLSHKAPSDYVFYDLLLSRPSLAEVEWLDVEGERSFEITITSETEVAGRIGRLPPRSAGSVRVGPNTVLESVAGGGPQGQSALVGTLSGWDGDYFRVPVSAGTRHIDFWAQVPVGQLWVFLDDEDRPLAIQGNGGWRQVSLPVFPGSRYFNVWVFAQSSGAETYRLTVPQLRSGYKTPFVSSGPGQITASPENGVGTIGGLISLTAEPGLGDVFQGWGHSQLPVEPTIQIAAGPGWPQFPQFSEANATLTFQGLVFDGVNTLPSVQTMELDGTMKPALVFDEAMATGDGVSRAVVGPARVRFRFLKEIGRDLSVELNGQPIGGPDPFGFDGEIVNYEALVPAGEHRLDFLYHRISSGAKSFILFDLEIQSGATVSAESSERGTVTITPRKELYQVGEKVVIAAQPNAGMLFDQWIGDLAGDPRSVELTISDHLYARPDFRTGGPMTEGNLPWHVEEFKRPSTDSDVSEDYFAAKLSLRGPGLLSLPQYEVEWQKIQLRINGKPTEWLFESEQALALIPDGVRTVRIEGKSAFNILHHQSHYVPGYAVLLRGDVGHIRLDPKRRSYSKGDTVYLDWEKGYQPSLYDVVFLDGQDIFDSMPFAIEVQGHVAHHLTHSRQIGQTGFQGNWRAGNVAQAADEIRFGEGISFLLTDTGSAHPRLIRSFEQAGIVRFDLRGLGADGSVQILVNDGLALSVVENSENLSLRIPFSGAIVEWRLKPGRQVSSQATALIGDIRFEASELSDFEKWMSQSVPAHVFAVSDALGSDDDLDGDGYPNGLERELSTNPYRYELNPSIGYRLLSGTLGLTVEFELPDEADRSTIYVGSYSVMIETEGWQWIALDALNYRSQSLATDRILYRIPVAQFSPHPLLLVRIERLAN